MAWAKTKNVWSLDAADALVEKNLLDTNMLGSTWGTQTAASSKEDGAFQKMVSQQHREMVRRLGQSGWTSLGGFTFGAGAAGTFQVAVSSAFVDGMNITEAGTGMNSDVLSTITALSPPGSSSRTDLLYLEVFIVEVPGSTSSVLVSTNKPDSTHIFKYGNVLYGGTNPGDDINEVNFEIRRRVQVQYRMRMASGINFVTYPSGLGDANVLAQGPNVSATAIPFAASPLDPGLWVAGNGSVAHQGILGTLDGKVYAIPVAKVTRIAGQTVVNSGDVVDLRQTWASNLSGGIMQAMQGYVNQHAIPTGAEIPYPGINIPNGFLAEKGQAVSRSSYSDLFASLTSTQTGNISNGSPLITGLANTSVLKVGLKVYATGVPSYATIQSIDSGTQVTMNANATLNGSPSILFHIWGAGDGSTTFNLPNRQGKGLVGEGSGSSSEDVSGTASGNAVPVIFNNSKWITGMPVTLSNVSGFVGISNGNYWVIRVNSTSISLAASLSGAQNLNAVAVTGTGAFTMTHTLTTRTIGETGGEEFHAENINELLAHNHPIQTGADATGAGGTLSSTWDNVPPTSVNTDSRGGNTAMNNMAPFGVTQWIIKT